ncbi:MAG: peptidoglycan DD-metalloendopeptidase family protein [Myxococcota bacterium]
MVILLGVHYLYIPAPSSSSLSSRIGLAMSSSSKPWVLYGVLGASLFTNVYMSLRSDNATELSLPSTAVAEVPLNERLDVPELAPAHDPVEEPVALSDDWHTLRVKVSHSLARTFQNSGIDEPDELNAVYSRLFMWDINMNSDLQAGDIVEVVYRDGSDGFPDIAAARFHSKKYAKIFSAYKWLSPDDRYASYWSVDGTEVPFRLKNSPIQDYEQITALLRDGRGHEGMDFKTPVGTQTVSPKAGTVVRTNWNTSYNGNCLEIQFSDGVLAKWLHMEEVTVKAGQKISAGTVVGKTGNTGRSTAPHLHYQLNKGKRVLDPIKYHDTNRRSLESEYMPSFLAEIAPFQRIMDEQGGIAGL